MNNIIITIIHATYHDHLIIIQWYQSCLFLGRFFLNHPPALQGIWPRHWKLKPKPVISETMEGYTTKMLEGVTWNLTTWVPCVFWLKHFFTNGAVGQKLYNCWKKMEKTQVYIYNQYRLKRKTNNWIFHMKKACLDSASAILNIFLNHHHDMFSGNCSISRITTPSQNLPPLRRRATWPSQQSYHRSAVCCCPLPVRVGFFIRRGVFFFSTNPTSCEKSEFSSRKVWKKIPIYKQVTWGMIFLPQKICPFWNGDLLLTPSYKQKNI